jgi:hypothetical protein
MARPRYLVKDDPYICRVVRRKEETGTTCFNPTDGIAPRYQIGIAATALTASIGFVFWALIPH